MEAEAKAFQDKIKKENEELSQRERKLTEKMSTSQQSKLDPK